MKKKMESAIAAQLAEAIKQSRKPDKPWCDGVLENHDIELEIKGYGRVPLPMRPADVREMSGVAKPAPFGKGTKTLVDEKVRTTLEIDASQVGYSDKFAEAVKGAKEKVAKQLQLETGRLTIELYKLLIYPKGGFFLPHRDSEKRQGMVATMVVVLPSRFGGGELVLQHAEHRKSYSFDQASKQQYPQFAAFYTDCLHEVRRVTSGVRMCLAFNLILTPARKPTTLDQGVNSALLRQVKAWGDHRSTDPLLFALEHQYTEAGLNVSQLKGADKELHRNVSAVAESLDCKLLFGQVERHLCQEAYPETRHHYGTGLGQWSGDYNDLEIAGIIDDVIVVDGWRESNGEQAKLPSLACESSQVICHIPAEDWIPTKADYEDYTGNAGNTLDRWYHKSVIAIWPSDRHFDVMAQMGIPFAIDQWHCMMKKLGDLDKSWEADRVDCIELAEVIVNRWPDRTYSHRNFDNELSSKLNSFADALPNLEVPDLIDKFLLVVAERDWNTDLKKLVTNALKRLEVDDVFASLEDFIRIEPAPNEYGIWFRDGIPVRDANWLLLLAKRKNHGGLSAEQLGGLLETAVMRIVAHANRFKIGKHSRSASPNESWLALCKALIAVQADGLLERLLRLLSDCPNVFDLRQFQVTAAVDLLEFPAKTNDSVPKSLTAWTAQLRSVLEKATKSYPLPPTDLRRESNTGCECRFCREMSSFLEDATQPKTRIAAAERSREHLTDVIRRRGLDVTTKTVRTGSPYSLELTKTTTSYREKVQRYKTDLKLLDRLT